MRAILPGVVGSIGGYPIGMPQVRVFSDVRRSAESMWHEIGSFQGIARWHPMVKAAEGEGEEPGATRTLETEDGQRWVERLTERDSGQRFYRYEITSTELPIKDFRGEFLIRERQPDRCTVVWTGKFEVTTDEEKNVSDMVREFFRAGARGIEKHFTVRPISALRRRIRQVQHRRHRA
jgi:Polyketide cyclase / dehydrase and lipid transport